MRMLDTARALLEERGSDDFTLQDIAALGKVSIGSIYYRFESKAELLRAVHRGVLDEIREDERELMNTLEQLETLRELVPQLVDGVAEILRRYSRPLAPLIILARTDESMSQMGQAELAYLGSQIRDILLIHRAEIRHSDPARAVYAVFRVVYASLARYLGLGAVAFAFAEASWSDEKRDLSDMCLAYLTTPDLGARRGS